MVLSHSGILTAKMFKALLLLTTCVIVAVVARSSPNAKLVEERYKSRQGGPYSNDVLEDAELDVPGLISKYGYPVEVHQVVTSDQYVLEMHRIPHGRDNYNNPNEKRPVVFVMHGLLSSSADFLLMGPGSALGYHLAEAGYDVWFGNARGNYYSRKHLTLNPDSGNSFWRFSWDEIGNLDLPAFIDYILEVTGESKVHYVGHSQGGTSFLVLNSLRPEYNDKFISFQGLAPASYFTYTENAMFKSLAPYEAILETTAWTIGMGEIFGSPDFMNTFQSQFCDGLITIAALDSICNGGLTNSILNREFYNATMLPVILGHTPAGASIRQISHYGQVIRWDAFRRYNFNALTNLSVYGRTSPPQYDLSKVTVPSYLHYGLSDSEVHYKDLLKLADNLPNVVSVNKMARDSFNHFDFIWGIDATEQVYNDLVAYMRDAEGKFL